MNTRTLAFYQGDRDETKEFETGVDLLKCMFDILNMLVKSTTYTLVLINNKHTLNIIQQEYIYIYISNTRELREYAKS